jgi:lactate dehydrogenase-like 2-hydroxyacid dehydrogenase
MQKLPIGKSDFKEMIITHHITWTSLEAREKLLVGLLKNIKEFL